MIPRGKSLCLLLAAVVATAVRAESPSWTYYNSGPSGSASGSNSVSWRPMPAEPPPSYQPYSTIDPAMYQNQPVQQPAGQQYLPPGSAAQSAGPQQPASGASQFQQYQIPNVASNPAAEVAFRVESGQGVLTPSNALPLPFGGMQSFYFSPKERALYQVMKIMLSPTQFNMIREAMEKYPNGGYAQQSPSPQGGYRDPAPAGQYGPPTTTTEAPIEEVGSDAIVPFERPLSQVGSGRGRPYPTRAKYNFTFSLRTWDGEECEFESEPEPNEGQNPRLQALPVRSKRGIMKCYPIEIKGGSPHNSHSKGRTVRDDDKNPLAPFNPPSGRGAGAPITRQRIENKEDGMEAFFSVANTHQQPPNFQRGARESQGSGSRGQYGPPQASYGPPKSQYGSPDKIESDQAGTSNANREQGRTGGGSEITHSGAVEV